MVPAAHYAAGVLPPGSRTACEVFSGWRDCLYGPSRRNRWPPSLLECLCFRFRGGRLSLARAAPAAGTGVGLKPSPRALKNSHSHNWTIAPIHVDYVVYFRTNKRLERRPYRIRLLAREIDEYYANFRVTND